MRPILDLAGAARQGPRRHRNGGDGRGDRVATYEYRCPLDGEFEVRLPLGEAGASVDCPGCRRQAAR
ncbi:hypothetical protein ACFQZ8_16970, partial [Micromonospora azadirachtae]